MDSGRTIRLNTISFDEKVKKIRDAGSKLTTAAKDVPEPSQSRGIILQDYIKKVKTIAALMSRYQLLLQVDVYDIETTAKKLQEADREARTTWKATN